jgi:hypothetical protein
MENYPPNGLPRDPLPLGPSLLWFLSVLTLLMLPVVALLVAPQPKASRTSPQSLQEPVVLSPQSCTMSRQSKSRS